VTGPENYAEAQRILREDGDIALARALVHATLAMSAAFALNIPEEGNEPFIAAWEKAGAW
jgi:hypothetical protein